MRTALAIAGCAWLWAAPAESQPDANEIMREAGARYAAAKQYEIAATVHVGKRRTSDGTAVREESLSMHVAFETPDKVLLEGAGVDLDGIDVYSDGKNAWAYSPAKNAYAALKKDEDVVSHALETAALLMQGFRPSALASSKILREEKLAAADCYVIALHDATTPPAGRLLWVDKRRLVILRQEESFDGGGIGITETTTADYTTVKINQPLPGSLFRFRPPPGAKRVDSLKQR